MSKEAENFLSQLRKGTRESTEAEDRRLETALGHIWEIARENKLDPLPTRFEIVPSNVMYEIGSYGLPDRFSHWTHGKTYRQMKTSYDYGLSKIYEVVINSDPSQAFLLENNDPIENIVVMAHVLGHTDFFKNNYLFQTTRRDMPIVASLNAKRIEELEYQKGKLPVEKVLDAALAIEEHIDPFQQNRPGRQAEIELWRADDEKIRKKLRRTGEFDDLMALSATENQERPALVSPPIPDKDLLGIIRNHAPELEEWERDVVDIVRSESLYFYPQMRTKIMNEGWAAFWHKRIMREMAAKKYVTPDEDEHVWKMHAGVVQPDPRRIQPYYFGMMMFEYLEDYYNGNLTKEENAWLQKEGHPVYPKYEGPLKDSPALPKLREVMESNDDQSFVRNYFNKITADRMNMFLYEEKQWGHEMITVVKDKGWMEIRDRLVEAMTNGGNPYLVVTNIDHEKRQELYIKHHHDGRDLEASYVEKTLPFVQSLWRRPVYIETKIEGYKTVFSFDGKELKKVSAKPPPPPPFRKPSAMERNWP